MKRVKTLLAMSPSMARGTAVAAMEEATSFPLRYLGAMDHDDNFEKIKN